MNFDLNFDIKDLIIFAIVVLTFYLMSELKLFGIENSVFGGPHKYYMIGAFAIVFTLLNHIKF